MPLLVAARDLDTLTSRKRRNTNVDFRISSERRAQMIVTYGCVRPEQLSAPVVFRVSATAARTTTWRERQP